MSLSCCEITATVTHCPLDGWKQHPGHHLTSSPKHKTLFISFRGLMWRDAKDIQGWVSVVLLELCCFVCTYCIHTPIHTQQKLYICASVHPSQMCEVGILLSHCWQAGSARPYNSPSAQAPGAAVLSQCVLASRGLQTFFSFKLSLIWMSLLGATAWFPSTSLG